MKSKVIIDNKSKKKVNKVIRKNKLEVHFRNAITILKNNPEAGNQIAKNRIPKELVRKFNINNLFVYNLVRKHPGWRLLYTIKPDGTVDILVVILQVLNHHKYDRLFSY